MSRKYCSICKEPHDNRHQGLCDKHLEQEEDERRESHNAESAQFQYFISMDDPEKWEKVFEFMRSQGWSP